MIHFNFSQMRIVLNSIKKIPIEFLLIVFNWNPIITSIVPNFYGFIFNSANFRSIISTKNWLTAFGDLFQSFECHRSWNLLETIQFISKMSKVSNFDDWKLQLFCKGDFCQHSGEIYWDLIDYETNGFFESNLLEFFGDNAMPSFYENV